MEIASDVSPSQTFTVLEQQAPILVYSHSTRDPVVKWLPCVEYERSVEESRGQRKEDREENVWSGWTKLWVHKTAQPRTVHTCREDKGHNYKKEDNIYSHMYEYRKIDRSDLCLLAWKIEEFRRGGKRSARSWKHSEDAQKCDILKKTHEAHK